MMNVGGLLLLFVWSAMCGAVGFGIGWLARGHRGGPRILSSQRQVVKEVQPGAS